jgi:hypothetical protein
MNVFPIFARRSPAEYMAQARILASEVAIHKANGDDELATEKAIAAVYCAATSLETLAMLKMLPAHQNNDPASS